VEPADELAGEGLGINPDRNHYVLPDGRSAPVAHTAFEPGGVIVYRVGKKAAGRDLDGRTWEEFPRSRLSEVEPA
jgi:protein gp37